ncbi:MAG: prolipoprotein diacylglyceryl transferase family protein [Actinomycetota bacterium]
MRDTGLLVSAALMWLVVAGAARWAPITVAQPRDVVDRLTVACFAGLVLGRLAAVLLDDRTSLRSWRSFLVIRGGVEFWPGVVAAFLVLVWQARRERTDVLSAVAQFAPFLLWGYSAFEASCLFRGGCFGPPSPLGLVPDGLRTRMFPVGLVVALVVGVLGYVVRQFPATDTDKLLVALGGVATARSVASVWLPRLGVGPTRQHLESVTVALFVVGAGSIVRVRAGLRGKAGTASTASPTDRRSATLE